MKTLQKPNGRYTIDLSRIIFEVINYPIKSSYILFFPRLYNLSYADFLRMVRDNYNATLLSKEGYMTFDFENKKDCDLFVKECNRRFLIWTNLNKK